MEHDQAIASMLAEKYILGELRDDDREQFEEHFFNCAECAQDVRDLSSVAQGAKELLKDSARTEPAQQRDARGWLEGWSLPQWLQPGGRLAWASAMLAVLVLAGYQNLKFGNAVRPQVLQSFMVHPESRGEATSVPVEKLGTFMLLEADLPGSSGNLLWNVRKSDSKDIVVQDAAPAPPRGESLKLLFPASSLAPAEYTLTVRRATELPEKLWTFRFRITQNLR